MDRPVWPKIRCHNRAASLLDDPQLGVQLGQLPQSHSQEAVLNLSMHESQVPGKSNHYVTENFFALTLVSKLVHQAVNLGCDLVARSKTVNVSSAFVGRSAFEMVEYLTAEQEPVIRVLSPIQCPCPLASLLVRTQVFEAAIPTGEKLRAKLKHGLRQLRSALRVAHRRAVNLTSDRCPQGRSSLNDASELPPSVERRAE